MERRHSILDSSYPDSFLSNDKVLARLLLVSSGVLLSRIRRSRESISKGHRSDGSDDADFSTSTSLPTLKRLPLGPSCVYCLNEAIFTAVGIEDSRLWDRQQNRTILFFLACSRCDGCVPFLPTAPSTCGSDTPLQTPGWRW